MHVYLATNYSRGVPDETFVKVIDAADRLRSEGHTPFIPHTMTFMWAIRYQHAVDYWYQFDLQWVDKCDALIRIPGESTGADAEVAYAKRKGIPVFFGVQAFLDHQRAERVLTQGVLDQIRADAAARAHAIAASMADPVKAEFERIQQQAEAFQS